MASPATVDALVGEDGASLGDAWRVGALSLMPTALENGQRSPCKLLRAVVARMLGRSNWRASFHAAVLTGQREQMDLG